MLLYVVMRVNQMHHKKTYKSVTDTFHVHFQLWIDPKFVHKNAGVILAQNTRASTPFLRSTALLRGLEM